MTDEAPKPFGHFLQHLGHGDALRELAEELQAVTAAAQVEASARRQPVTATLTLTVKLAVDDRGFATVGYSVTGKRPQRRTATTPYLVSKHGNLITEDPRQGMLPLRQVDVPDLQIRTPGGDHGER